MHQKDKNEKEEIILCDVGECCICFSLRLNDKLPEIVCQNASCEQFFHKECLHQVIEGFESQVKSFYLYH